MTIKTHFQGLRKQSVIETQTYENFKFPDTISVNEPPCGKTNNVVSEQVRHKPACTSTEVNYSKNRRIGQLYKSSTFVRAPVQTFPTSFPIKCLLIRAPPRYNRHRPVFSFPKRQLFFIRRPHYYLSNLQLSIMIHNR